MITASNWNWNCTHSVGSLANDWNCCIVCVVNAKALSIMRCQDDINNGHNMKSIGRAAVAQWTKRLTRNWQTRVRIRKEHIFDIIRTCASVPVLHVINLIIASFIACLVKRPYSINGTSNRMHPKLVRPNFLSLYELALITSAYSRDEHELDTRALPLEKQELSSASAQCWVQWRSARPDRHALHPDPRPPHPRAAL